MILKADNVTLKYGKNTIVKNLNMEINKGKVVTIIGPNGSGKSTILKALGRYLKPSSGKILLEGKDINELKTKSIAKKVAILPQMKNVPADFIVESLVSCGRYPHLSFGSRLGKEDYDIINWAIEKTSINHLRNRQLKTLSGGERQRVWIAMALAQNPEILILDEPTTFLDISYQLEVLELVKNLNESIGLTIIMVLHDLNQAVRYSHKVYVIKDGAVYKHGDSKVVINKELLREVFGIEVNVFKDYISGCPYFIPQKSVECEAKAL